MQRYLRLLCFLCLGVLLVAFVCTQGYADTAQKDATAATKTAQQNVVAELNFADMQDFEDAKRGFIAPLPNAGLILDAQGRTVWNASSYDFLTGKSAETAPATVNPSLWRQSRLVMQGGLFKVCKGIYQVRNADISNLTIIEGNTGLIIVDPLVSEECARAALALYYAHRPKKPVHTVIYSHSHVDHYGGILGVVREADVREGRVRIIAPQGFLDAAVAENVFAGTAMARRASFMYGTRLAPSPRGHVGSGLGLKNSQGTKALIPPTDVIRTNGEQRVLDGLTFVFLLAPNTEAPAEMHWYIPEYRALTAAENCVHTMHNLYTLRGAKTRDSLSWAKALEETLVRFGEKTDVLYGMHHWPVFGNERVCSMLAKTRDLYRYIHDQTLHLANLGYTMNEIAESLQLPPELAREFALRGYYGSLNHNIKAVYNLYLGWFDGNPSHLHPLPPVAAAKEYVRYMGGAPAVLAKAREDFAKGNYRFVAEVLNHVVFADPTNREARELEADALEQLGYQAESGPWRNFYLTGAAELRNTVKNAQRKDGGDTQAKNLPLDLYFANLSIRLDGQKAHGKTFALRLDIEDSKVSYVLELSNAVLHTRKLAPGQTTKALVHIKATRERIVDMFETQRALKEELLAGNSTDLQAFLDLFVTFDPLFAIVEP